MNSQVGQKDCEPKTLEEMYPGKVLEILSFTDFEQYKTDFAFLRTEFRNYVDEQSSIIFAYSEAVMWGDDEKAIAKQIENVLSAYREWHDTLSKHYDAQSNTSSSLRLLMSNLGLEISETCLELANTLFSAEDYGS